MPVEDLKPYHFLPGKSGNLKGRPRAITSDIIKQLTDAGFTPVKPLEVSDAFMVLLQLPEEQLKRCVTEAELPMFIRIVAKELLSSRGFEAVEKLLDRAHGRAKQTIDSTIKLVEQPLLSDEFASLIVATPYTEVKKNPEEGAEK